MKRSPPDEDAPRSVRAESGTSSPTSKPGRRSFLRYAAAAASAPFVGGTRQEADPEDVPRGIGDPATPLGRRADSERIARRTSVGVSTSPLQDLVGAITPSDLHYEVHHAGIPRIDPDRFKLIVHGMIRRPRVFSLSDLERFPSVSRIHFLECSGNYRRNASTETTPEMLAGLTSQSEWTGVSLATLFREIGVLDEATWFLAEGQDGAAMSRSIPVAKGWDDAILAYGQNGERLRPAQGYPLRLILPGWEGNACVKWLRRIEFTDQPLMQREETARYTERMADQRIRQFSFEIDARSVITSPSYPDRLVPGWVEIRGLAWTGRGRIQAVEISTDNGETWSSATLQQPVLECAHTRFRYLWHWAGDAAAILSRAVDETGYRQPSVSQLIAERGVRTASYHLNPITGWTIQPSGQVLFREEAWA